MYKKSVLQSYVWKAGDIELCTKPVIGNTILDAAAIKTWTVSVVTDAGLQITKYRTAPFCWEKLFKILDEDQVGCNNGK